MKMEVGFSSTGNAFDVTFDSGRQAFDTEFEGMLPVAGGGDPYLGEYDVIPRRLLQILRTRGKVMSDDVTVHEIPYAEVTNISGGLTATIG